MREQDILQQIREYLTIRGWFVVRIHQTLGCYPGIPDLLAYGPDGRRVDIEIKGPRGKQSQAQRLYQENLEVRGHEYRLVRSLEDVRDL